MKKVLAIFLIFSSTISLNSMDPAPQSLAIFQNKGWRIVSISAEKPKSGECVKAVYADRARLDNKDQNTQTAYPIICNMRLCLSEQIKKENKSNSVSFGNLKECNFLSQEMPSLPKPICYLIVKNKIDETRILEIDTATKPVISFDETEYSSQVSEPAVKHNMDQSPIAFTRPKNQPQATSPTPQPKIEIPSAVAKPQSATTRFIGGFLMTLTLPLAALFAAYSMGYVSSDDISQFLNGIRQSFSMFGFPPAED